MVCGERLGLIDNEAFRVGSWVRIEGGEYGEPIQYKIVGRADPETTDNQHIPEDCCIDLVEN
jgi:hypothetical protein